MKDACIFCGYINLSNDKKLILLEYESVNQKIKNKCRLKGDLEFKRKIGGKFENLPALDARYQDGCYKKYLSEKCTEPIGPQYCFSTVHKLFKSIARRRTSSWNTTIIKNIQMLFARKQLWKLWFVHNKKDCCNMMDLLL